MSGIIPVLPLYAFMACLRTTILSLLYLKELYTVWFLVIPVDRSDKICVCDLPLHFNLKNNVAIHNIFKSYMYWTWCWTLGLSVGQVYNCTFLTLFGISFAPGFLGTVLVVQVVKVFIPVSHKIHFVTPNVPGFPRVKSLAFLSKLNCQGRLEHVRAPVKNFCLASLQGRTGWKSLHKIERQILNYRVPWAWSERENLYNRQLVILLRKTETCNIVEARTPVISSGLLSPRPVGSLYRYSNINKLLCIFRCVIGSHFIFYSFLNVIFVTIFVV